MLLLMNGGCSRTAAGFQREQFESIAKKHGSGSLKDEEGVIRLPDELAGITIDGRVYVTKNPTGSLYMFLTWRGKGSNLRGYVYSPTNQIPPQTISIEVVGPTVLHLGKDSGLVEVELKPMSIAGWYQAARTLD